MTAAVGVYTSQQGVPAAAAAQTQANAAYQALVTNNGNLVLKTINTIFQQEITNNLQREARKELPPDGTVLLKFSGSIPGIKGQVSCYIRTEVLFKQVVPESPEMKIRQLTPLQARLFSDTLQYVISLVPSLSDVVKIGLIGCDGVTATSLQDSTFIRNIVLRVTGATKLTVQ